MSDDLFTTDAFLTALSKGEVSADDDFASDFAGLVDEVGRDIPPAPLFLATGEQKRATNWRGLIGSGLVGAAASALVIAGVGGAIFNSQPGDALWSANQSLFGDHATVVELASTLQEADAARTRGDTDGALALLQQAHVLAAALGNTQQQADVEKPEEQPTHTVTVTESPATPPTEKPAPTSTEPQPTVTVTETVTVTAGPAPTPTMNVAPTLETGTVAPAPTTTPSHTPEIGAPPIID
ncbi:hypothetical protein [Corynebacterium glucuronolyticum]|uniref:hypothetical protein n=1 Tax=Corynebacterium glucuronolyticum TaxID=39791 RepID=UPI00223AE539|nr:hypothetical protein [Corynebacterium glucuronolyticum]MCT1562836.1 hypothetical protein [Corynebacterium glucuronolyticum]